MKRALRIAGLVLFVLVGVFWWATPIDSEPQIKWKILWKTRPENKPSPKAIQKNTPYKHFAKINERLKQKRFDLATCILNDPNFSHAEMDLQLTWNGAGALEQIELSPKPNNDSIDCFEQTLSPFHVPPHPALKPIRLTKRLILGPDSL